MKFSKIFIMFILALCLTDLCSAEIYDDFTTNEIQSDKWNFSGDSEFFTIENSSLKFSTNSPDKQLNLDSKILFPSDFEIEIKFSNFLINPMDSGLSQLFMGIYDGDDKNVIQISRATTTWGDQNWLSIYSTFSDKWDWSIPSTISNGYFKISRIGNKIQCYYSNDGSKWNMVHEYTDKMLGHVSFFVAIHSGGITSPFTAWLDTVSYSGLTTNKVVEWWDVQNRKYEDGRDFNTAHFTMKDTSNNYLLEDVISSIELFDPDGVKVLLTKAEFGSAYKTVSGQYDANNGRWNFGDSLHDESYYFITLLLLMKH